MANQYTGRNLTFECVLDRKVYQNDDNDFKIYAVKVDNSIFPDVVLGKYGSAIIMGNKIFELSPNVTYIANTREITTPRGISYEVNSIQSKPLVTYEDKLGYLSSILTPLQARTLLNKYPDIINRVRQDYSFEPDYKELPGITESKFLKMKIKINENYQYSDICGVFYDVMSMSIIKKLKAKYDSVDMIKMEFNKDPYDALCSIKGIGFKKADKICLDIEDAAQNRINNNQLPRYTFPFQVRDSIQRCQACMIYCLEEMESTDGSTRINLEDLKYNVGNLVHESVQYFTTALSNNEIFYYNPELETVSLIKTFNKELYITQKLVEGLNSELTWEYDGDLITSVNKSDLTDEQVQTQNEILNNNIVLLTGSAGSGKSFSMKAMITMLEHAHKSSILLSPTAKAAKVLAASTGKNASTIHRGLGVDRDGKFVHNEYYPLDFDIVIVDEFSMVDTDLFYNLLKAIDFNTTKLLLIFDPAQLASVGPGNIAYDLVQSELFSMVALNKIFRYSEGGLVAVATDVRNCVKFLPREARFKPIKFGKSFAFFPEDNENSVELAVNLYSDCIDKGYDFNDIIVISAQNKGPQGVVNINNMIQERINPQPPENCIKIKGDDETEIQYRLNDVIMQTANDYKSIVCDKDGYYEIDLATKEPVNEILIANGENGRIIKVTENFVVVQYGDFLIYRDRNQLQKTQLGYAITCHKSQGSGYKNVIVVAPSSHTWQLNSNLLYVAFTRAKERCWCIGDIDAINKASTKKMEIKRKTNLSVLLKKLGGKNNV